jgi:hypothetical protein
VSPARAPHGVVSFGTHARSVHAQSVPASLHVQVLQPSPEARVAPGSQTDTGQVLPVQFQAPSVQVQRLQPSAMDSPAWHSGSGWPSQAAWLENAAHPEGTEHLSLYVQQRFESGSRANTMAWVHAMSPSTCRGGGHMGQYTFVHTHSPPTQLQGLQTPGGGLSASVHSGVQSARVHAHSPSTQLQVLQPSSGAGSEQLASQSRSVHAHSPSAQVHELQPSSGGGPEQPALQSRCVQAHSPSTHAQELQPSSGGLARSEQPLVQSRSVHAHVPSVHTHVLHPSAAVVRAPTWLHSVPGKGACVSRSFSSTSPEHPTAKQAQIHARGQDRNATLG